MTNGTSKRAVIYLRVSSTQQAEKDYDAEGYSLPAQREACRRKAETLNADVVEEFMDRGESAKTTDREGLQAMLRRITQGGIDYVIVHKVDRLARNRADDALIALQIREAGAQLVSVSENIDETPSGLLLHGIMSSIAEFYSRNLATEIIKGSNEKAKKGGTPYRAPIGYVNAREIVDGREIRVIKKDPERADLITDAFKMYATGDYALSELAGILEARGLRTRPTRRSPAKALGINRLSSILKNDYYTGKLSYNGDTYDGRHEPLIDKATFAQVQVMLEGRRQSGERNWKHYHYLRGTIYCGECGRRLFFQKVRGNGGEYEYFCCKGRQDGLCSQRYHRVDAVEAAVENEYAKIVLSSKARRVITDSVDEHFHAIEKLIDKERGKVKGTVLRLKDEERKLLDLRYQDQISTELFGEEQARIRQERETADRLLESLNVKTGETEKMILEAIDLTTDIHAAYLMADVEQRRLFNQAIFERIEIDDEEIVAVRLTPQVAAIVSHDLALTEKDPRPHVEHRPAAVKNDLEWLQGLFEKPKPEHSGVAPTGRQDERTSKPISGRGGSHVETMVRLRGVEPPRPCGHKPLKLARLPIPPQPPEVRGF